MQFFDFPRDELPVQTSLLTLILTLRSETHHVPTQFLHDLTLHFPFLSFFLTMFVLFRSMVSSLHSLVRSFRSFSLKLDMMCACLAYGLKNELSTQVTLLTREKFLPYCGTI